jgi:hypothetical protein
MERNLCKQVLLRGGSLTPLIIPDDDTKGLGLMNPSILVYKDQVIVNLRSINYTLYHCEGDQRFQQRWGPLQYLNPENDVKLKTNNFLCILDDKFNVDKHFKIDTSNLDIAPVWEFHGLEDCRLIEWDDKLYVSGVRRDVKPNGEGRMELSEIVISDDSVQEISRFRIPDPLDDEKAYCNKNWMPVIDMPFHYVKWSNPTEVVITDPKKKTCKTVFVGNERLDYQFDFRGGSQVINWGDYRLALVHETCVFKNKLEQKDATYTHRFIVWDREWNIVHVSDVFSLMTAMIEFSCGMTFYKEDLLLTFGFQDNAAYLLKIPKDIITDVIGFDPNKKILRLDGMPTINVISYYTCVDRRDILKEQFDKYNIKNFKFNVTFKQDDDLNKDKITGKFAYQLSTSTINNTVSHIEAVREWYYNTNDKIGLFVEDDISLETINYWNFTWNDFIDNLPYDWDCIQLVCLDKDLDDVKFKKRDLDYWSITGYLITRKYAKFLLEEYGAYNFELRDRNIIPDGEALIYLSGTTYCIPLFVENTSIPSVIRNNKIDGKGIEMHKHSSEFVLNWWKENGNKVNIKKLMSL